MNHLKIYEEFNWFWKKSKLEPTTNDPNDPYGEEISISVHEIGDVFIARFDISDSFTKGKKYEIVSKRINTDGEERFYLSNNKGMGYLNFDRDLLDKGFIKKN